MDDGILASIMAAVPPARGRASQELDLELVRELGPEDIPRLSEVVGTGSRPLDKLRHVHHLLARLIAEGRKAVECSAITGYSQSRICILQDDPMFKELVAYYGAQKEAVYLDVHQRLATLGTSAVEELQERLEDTPEKFSIKDLRELAESTLDRSVTSPQGPKNGPAGGVNVTITFVQPEGPLIEGQVDATKQIA